MILWHVKNPRGHWFFLIIEELWNQNDNRLNWAVMKQRPLEVRKPWDAESGHYWLYYRWQNRRLHIHLLINSTHLLPVILKWLIMALSLTNWILYKIKCWLKIITVMSTTRTDMTWCRFSSLTQVFFLLLPWKRLLFPSRLPHPTSEDETDNDFPFRCPDLFVKPSCNPQTPPITLRVFCALILYSLCWIHTASFLLCSKKRSP